MYRAASRSFLSGLAGISELRKEAVQDTPLETFDDLAGDNVLFIDTSHVSKTGSDVNWLYENVLPRLRAGVVVHIHDIFLPGDYPHEWVLDGWGWNELYLVRAFLAYNSAFRIEFGTWYMITHHPEVLKEAFLGSLSLTTPPEAVLRSGFERWSS